MRYASCLTVAPTTMEATDIYIYFIDCSIIKFTRLKHLVMNSGKNTLPKEEFWFEKNN